MPNITLLQDLTGGGDDTSNVKLLNEVNVGIAPRRNAIAAGLSSGMDDLQGLGYSTGAALADIVGADKARDWLNEQARKNQVDARLNGRADLERIEDQTLGSALPYLGYQIAKQVPNIAGSIAAGALVPEVAVPAALARGASFLPRALGGGGLTRGALEAAEGYAAKKAVVEGARATGQTVGRQILGGAAFNETQAIGALYQEAKDNPDISNPGLVALGLSPAYALAETLPEAMLVGRLSRGSGFSGNLLSRVGKAAGTQAATGATSEIAQTAMELGVGAPKTGDEIRSQFLNAGVAGGLVEGVLGGFGGIKRRPGVPNAPGNDVQQALQQGSTPGAAPFVGPQLPPFVGPPTPPLVGPPAPSAAAGAATAPTLVGPAPTPPAVTGGTTEIAQTAQAAAAEQAKVDTATREQAARERAFGVVGGQLTTDNGGTLTVFGQPIFGPQIQTFGNALVQAINKLPEHGQAVVRALAQAHADTGNKLVNFAYNGSNPLASAKKLVDTLAKVADKYQIGHVTSVEQAANILNQQSRSLKGQKLDQLNAIYTALTGSDTDGYLEAQGAATSKGAKNGKLQVQNASGVGAVREQGSAGAAPEGNGGAVQPSGVQSVGAGGVPEGSLGLQTGQLPGERVRTGSGAVPISGNGGVGEQAPQITSAEDLLRRLVNGGFGPEGDYSAEDRQLTYALVSKIVADGLAAGKTNIEILERVDRSTQQSLSTAAITELDRYLTSARKGEPYVPKTPTAPQGGTGETAVQPAGAATDAAGVRESRAAPQDDVLDAQDEVATGEELLAAEAETISDEVLKLLVPPTSRMNEEVAQKQRDFIFTLLVNGPYATHEVMAADFGIKLYQAKDWSAKAKEIRENPAKLKAAYEAVAQSRGLTIPELLACINAKASRSVNAIQEVDRSISTSREQGGPTDSDERKLRADFDAENVSDREATDEGLAVKSRKSGESVQEQFNAVDTNDAAVTRILNELKYLDDSLESGKSPSPSVVSKARAAYEKAFLDASKLTERQLAVLALDAYARGEQATGDEFRGQLEARQEAAIAKGEAQDKKNKRLVNANAGKDDSPGAETQSAPAAKLAADAAAKRAAERNGLDVGDTVRNPKLGEGTVEGFAGNGSDTRVTVKFNSGVTKELLVSAAKLEKINAVQEPSAASVDARSEAGNGKAVGEGNAEGGKAPAKGKAEKPAAKKPRKAKVTAKVGAQEVELEIPDGEARIKEIRQDIEKLRAFVACLKA
jgi:hypothetical protein